jgi:hypothetical protein
MRLTDLSSPGVAHRGLQKLLELGLAEKDAYGRYFITEKIDVKGHVWLGKTLFPRFIILAFFFTGLLIVEAVVLAIRLSTQEAIDTSYVLLMAVTTFSLIAFAVEGLQLKRGVKETKRT